ncbi:MAG: tetratricopeptide repeat protein, partial [Deltaproteobacteria bacterium]|nr:tetratricopeptide repeat protein [Deltaproteobacteria bacterium]
YLNMGEVKKAEEVYGKIIRDYPSITVIQTKLELVRNLRKGPKEILDTAYRYYQRYSDDTRAVFGYVQALILNNRLEEAMGVLRKAIKKDPKNVQYPVMLGDLLLVQKNLSGAREAFQQALQLAPKNINVLIDIGGRYEKYLLDKEAEVIYLRAYAMYPENVLIINQLAWYYTDTRGDMEKARPFIDTLRVKGEGAYEKDTVGWFFYKTKDFNSAEAYFREALQLDPDNNIIRGHLALALFQANRSKEALVEAERVTKVLPPGDLKSSIMSFMEHKKKGAGK